MSRTVKVDAAIWDAICEHYAALEHPTAEDQAVQRYMVDKTARQILHDSYMAQKRSEALWDNKNTPA